MKDGHTKSVALRGGKVKCQEVKVACGPGAVSSDLGVIVPPGVQVFSDKATRTRGQSLENHTAQELASLLL